MTNQTNLPADEVFVQQLTSRIQQHQRKRKTLFISIFLIAAVTSCAGFILLPGPMLDIGKIGIGDVFTVLVLAAICAIAIMATELKS